MIDEIKLEGLGEGIYVSKGSLTTRLYSTLGDPLSDSNISEVKAMENTEVFTRRITDDIRLTQKFHPPDPPKFPDVAQHNVYSMEDEPSLYKTSSDTI